MSIEFFNTKMGRQFYEATVPNLVKVIERVAGALEKRPQIPPPFDNSDVVAELEVKTGWLK